MTGLTNGEFDGIKNNECDRLIINEFKGVTNDSFENILNDKKALRKWGGKNRNSIPAEERKLKDGIILEKLKECDAFKNAKCVFTFVSYKSEVDTKNIIEFLLETGVRVASPVVMGERMEFFEIKDFSDLKESGMGILEPDIDREEIRERVIKPGKGDVMLVPGLLYSKDLYRLGYGGGFYDRYISDSGTEIYTIGICYREQIVDNLPVEEHDRKLKEIITD